MSAAGAVIVVSPAELEAMIERAVRRALDDVPRAPAEWLDTRAAAELLGVHPKSAARLARAGKLPSSRIGKTYRFERAEILEWMRRRSTRAAGLDRDRT